MARLHELLAVEKGLEKTAMDSILEARTTFAKKPAHFTGFVKTYKPFEESKRDEEGTIEHLEMMDTVPEKLRFVWNHVTRWLDAVLQKEATNQEAKADLVIDGQTVATEVPATFLLGLETKLKQIRLLLTDTPTLAPGIKWESDSQKGDGVYSAVHPEEKFRTKKIIEHKIIVPATDKHPAQVEKWTADQNVGKYTMNKWCGMLSSADKSEILARLDKIERGVKQARQRANGVEVVKSRIGDYIGEYLFCGTVEGTE